MFGILTRLNGTSEIVEARETAKGYAVEFEDGRRGVTVTADHFHPLPVIRVPRSHLDDFNAHIGTWAVIDRPPVQEKGGVIFVLDDGKTRFYSIVLDLHQLDPACPSDQRWLTAGQTKSLAGWWLVTYAVTWMDGRVPRERTL